MSDELPPMPRPRKARPLMSNTSAALGWCHRAANAVGSDRFAETIRRATFYADRAGDLALTPAEAALAAGLEVMVDKLIAANARSRVLLADSVSGMDAAEATEFVEMIEGGEDLPLT